MQLQYKSGKNPYNYITFADAKTKAEGLYTKTQNNVISRLCSGYAWDTALKFIETKYPNYGTSGKSDNYYGNYADVSFTYTAIDGTIKTKDVSNEGSGTLIPTGQTTAVNNIYDMGGNVVEITNEITKDGSKHAQCGGCYGNTSEYAPGARTGVGSNLFAFLGFRITLFL